MCSLSHQDVVYPVIGVALDRCSSSEVDVEVNVLLDLRFIFCTISSAGTGDKPSLPKAGLQQLEAVFCGLFLPDIFPPCAAARWRRCFRCVQYLVYIWNWPVMTLAAVPFPCSNHGAVCHVSWQCVCSPVHLSFWKHTMSQADAPLFIISSRLI